MLTLTAIKADVGSVGGHTRPSLRMLETAHSRLAQAVDQDTLVDFDVTHTGDDICLLMVHPHGSGSSTIHNFAWDVFTDATLIAKEEGLYGAGQDLLKDAPSDRLADAIRRVHAGGRAIDPDLAAEAWSEPDPLTDRERQVLRLAGDGRTGAEIADELGLSEGTVRNYLSEAMSKLGAKNRVEAARLARTKGWL